jgi:flagellar motor switch protein FliN/FliY
MSDINQTADQSAQASGTLGLLLDLELPVSVSFGKAQMPLQQVLKWTSGSIVELESAVNDPVEIVVNNCVIARGEVVVVDGNYGVRIQQIVSREQRLETTTGPLAEV